MSHGHGHGSADDGSVAAGPRTRAVLAALVAVMIALTVAGVVALWPDHDVLSASLPNRPDDNVGYVSGTVRTLTQSTCEGDSSDRLADGTVPATAVCVTATVRLDPPATGTTATQEVPVPPQVARAGMGVGDKVRLARYPAEAGQPFAYGWVGYDRGRPLLWLGLAFAAVVIGIARMKGVSALIGLAITYPTITYFMLPALRMGSDPVLVAVTGSSALMIVVLYLAHGISTKTTTALLGTQAGLLLTAGIAWWATSAAHLDGLNSEENYELNRLTSGAGLGGIVLCGVIIAGLGVLNDVTISQASSVWELRSLAPHLSARQLFVRGSRIGRDHLASTVYTIAFAYAGAALPTLLLIGLYQQPLYEVVTGGQISEEIVRTMVGAIGLVLAIPLTTAIAALVASSARVRGADPAGHVPGAPASAVPASGVPDSDVPDSDVPDSGVPESAVTVAVPPVRRSRHAAPPDDEYRRPHPPAGADR